MADVKISGMAAATALTGAEVLPVVQSAANVKATTQQVVDAAMTTGLTRQALGSINTNTTIDWSAGSYVTATIGGALTFTFSNPAPTGKACVAYLQLTNGGSSVITWPVSVTWSGGTAPTLRASGVDLLRFYTQDNGTTWFGTAEIDEQQFAASAITSGTLDADRLPTPTTTALGGVKRNTGSAGQYVTGIDTDGSLLRDTPAGVDVQEFTSSGTWTKPTNAKRVTAYLVGGGGGGASGTSNGATSQRGGGGGGAGRCLKFEFLASSLSATESVTVGAGGGGGAGASNSAFGVAGSTGGSSSFAGATAPGGIGAANSGTGGGGGGSFAHGSYPWFQDSDATSAGGTATTSSAATGGDVSDNIMSTGGGAGGWISAGGASNAGARGGTVSTTRGIFADVTGGAGGPADTAGTAGASKYTVGSGGGGGGSSSTGAGGAGGAGGFPGGGGGGGGAALSGGALSGAGGAGGDGYVVVITECSA